MTADKWADWHSAWIASGAVDEIPDDEFRCIIAHLAAEERRSELFAKLVSDVAAALGLKDTEDRSNIGGRVADLKRKARLLREAINDTYSCLCMECREIADAALRETEDLEEAV